MPDSDDIIAALQANWAHIGIALGAEAGRAFVAEYGPLNQAARGAATSAQQEQATADLIALLQRYPVVLQVLAQSDPATFGAWGSATPVAAPVGGAPVDPAPVPPLPDTAPPMAAVTPATPPTTPATAAPPDPPPIPATLPVVAPRDPPVIPSVVPAAPGVAPPTDTTLLDSLAAASTPAVPPAPPDAAQRVAVEPSATYAPAGPLHQQPDEPRGGAPDGPGPLPLTPAKETPAMAQADTPPTPPADPNGWNGARFREWIAAILAITLVAGTVLLAAWAIITGNTSDNAKNILLLITPLCGVVVGYYFGRIPSEAQAQAATARATQAEGEAARVKAVAGDAIDDAAAIAGKAVAGIAGGNGTEGATRGGLEGGNGSSAGLAASLQQDLLELQRRARRL